MNALEKRVLDISYKKGLSHIGSCLTAVNIIDKIYSIKKDEDIFILSAGHKALALYVVLEQWLFKDAEALFDKHGVHPNRDLDDGIYCSSGSLGSAITIAVGMALANKDRLVYVLLSDGEMAEGSCWEALRIASDLRLENLRITVDCNGYGALGKIDTEIMDARMQSFYPSLCIQSNVFSFPHFLQGLGGHYTTMTEDQYKLAMEK